MNKNKYIIIRSMTADKTLGVFDLSANDNNKIAAEIIQYLFNKNTGVFAGLERDIARSNRNAPRIKRIKRPDYFNGLSKPIEKENDKLKKYHEDAANKYTESIISSIKDIRDGINTDRAHAVLKYLQINSSTMSKYISIEEIEDNFNLTNEKEDLAAESDNECDLDPAHIFTEEQLSHADEDVEF